MLIEERFAQDTFVGRNHKTQTKIWASQLYDRFCNQDWLQTMWLALTGRTHHLLDLPSVQASQNLLSHRYVGIQMVPISQILGSASTGRSQDFDAAFRPLRSHSKSRWLSVATAKRTGIKLPPIELFQVGEIYFVGDGHHRVSVAKAQGEQVIEAEVTFCQVAKPVTYQEHAITSA
jgi:hypothetical protein